ncbi:MAG: holin, partial [Pyramidobacter sp.]|nr:holin [Pyramidobacter sp.]
WRAIWRLYTSKSRSPITGLKIWKNHKMEVHNMRNWKNWFKAAGVRAVKTVAQTAVATIGTSAVMGEVNWLMVGSASLLAGVLSLLTSVAGLPEVTE